MKLHRTLAEASRDILTAVFEDGRVAERELARMFRSQRRWGKRDRGFVAETVFEVARWRRALAFVVGADDPASLCSAQWSRMGVEIPDWWTWRGCGTDEMGSREGELGQQERAVRESIPDWLDRRAQDELGGLWDDELRALNRRAQVFLRVNRILATRSEVIGWLASEGIQASEVEGCDDGLALPKGKVLPKPLAGDGRIALQDAASQQIAPMLEVVPGMRVIDTCAGAGGKTLHLAALMEGQGELVALDVNGRKLEELQRRARAAEVHGVRTEVWQADSEKRHAGWADRVLIDAPCSGLGTLRRQPDLKWRLTEPELEKIKRIQRKLLDHHGALLRKDGKLVYATCSVLPSENQRQIEQLLERDPRWDIEEERVITCSGNGWDGFYAVRLRRKNSGSSNF